MIQRIHIITSYDDPVMFCVYFKKNFYFCLLSGILDVSRGGVNDMNDFYFDKFLYFVGYEIIKWNFLK